MYRSREGDLCQALPWTAHPLLMPPWPVVSGGYQMRKARRMVAVKLPFYCTTKNARKAPRCKFFKIPTLTDTTDRHAAQKVSRMLGWGDGGACVECESCCGGARIECAFLCLMRLLRICERTQPRLQLPATRKSSEIRFI